MSGIILDGRKLALGIENELRESGSLMGKKLLILQCDGADAESVYVRLKRQMGERLGVRVEVRLCGEKAVIMRELEYEQEKFDGVLVQLPILNFSKVETKEILSKILPEKDVDGLNPNSQFLTAATVAVEKVIEFARISGIYFKSVAVVGAKGTTGGSIVRRMRLHNYEVEEFDLGSDLSQLKNYDVVISATGSANLIKGDMLKSGVVTIDLGYPKGDCEFESVSRRAALITPVPGGVGPLTVVSLYSNMVNGS